MTHSEKQTKFENTIETKLDAEETSSASQNKTTEENPKPAKPKSEVDMTLTAREKNLSALGYISFLCVLPLCMEPKSSFCKSHGKQGMVITILFFFLSWIGNIHGVLWFLLFLLHIGLIVWGIMNSLQGKTIKIPMISDISEKIDI